MGRLTNNDHNADARIAGVNENKKNMPNFVEKIVFSVNGKGEQANFYLKALTDHLGGGSRVGSFDPY
jgi:hypothetical protein